MVTDYKKQLSDKLIELNKQITKEDRAAYLDKYKITQGNLSLYMNGNIHDIEKAMEMISFFKTRIEERNLKIQQLIN